MIGTFGDFFTTKKVQYISFSTADITSNMEQLPYSDSLQLFKGMNSLSSAKQTIVRLHTIERD